MNNTNPNDPPISKSVLPVVGRCNEKLTHHKDIHPPSISPGKLINSGLKIRDIKFLLFFLGRVGDTQGNKSASADSAGFRGSRATLVHQADRVLQRAKIPLDDYLSVYGASLTDCIKAIGDGLKQTDQKAFISKTGEVVVSKPFVNADAGRVRLQAADRGLALGGYITQRKAIQVTTDQVRADRGKRTIRDLKAGPDGVYE